MRSRINGIMMSFEVAGPETAPAIVLHHPLATNLSTWDTLTGALVSKFRVVRFDARGHGASEAPKGAYSLDLLASDVVALMDHLRIDKARFLGLSMGGMVGQILGLNHQQRFHSLCLVSTTSRVPPEAKAIWDERIRNAPATGMAGTIEAAMARWISPTARETRPVLVERMKQLMLATPVDGYVGWCHAIRALDATDRLGAIKIPTLVVVGALDPATTPAAAEAIHKAIPGSELKIVPGMSHMLQEEEPAAFAADVMPFLAKHGPAA